MLDLSGLPLRRLRPARLALCINNPFLTSWLEALGSQHRHSGYPFDIDRLSYPVFVNMRVMRPCQQSLSKEGLGAIETAGRFDSKVLIEEGS